MVLGYINTEWKGIEYFPIYDFHHIEFLTGNAKQQFLEWRKFLKRMYELEKTPDVQL